MRSHSWSLVNLSMRVTRELRSRPLVARGHERKLRDHNREPLAAYLGKQSRGWLARAAPNIAHGDRCAETYAEPAGGHDSDRQRIVPGCKQRGARTHRGAPWRPQADATAACAFGNLLHHDFGAGEAAWACAAGAPRLRKAPVEPRLDQRGRLVEVGAIKAKAGFEPQAVTRSKAYRCDRGIAQQRLP